MVLAGAKNLSALGTFGQMGYTEVFQNGAPVYYYYDDSLQILIYSVIAIFLHFDIGISLYCSIKRFIETTKELQ